MEPKKYPSPWAGKGLGCLGFVQKTRLRAESLRQHVADLFYRIFYTVLYGKRGVGTKVNFAYDMSEFFQGWNPKSIRLPGLGKGWVVLDSCKKRDCGLKVCDNTWQTFFTVYFIRCYTVKGVLVPKSISPMICLSFSRAGTQKVSVSLGWERAGLSWIRAKNEIAG